MSELIQSYQEEQQLIGKEPENCNFATVAAVEPTGLRLRFDGEEEASEKLYKCNAFVVFKVDDRVRIVKDSGTYVVEYPVGNPLQEFRADVAAEADHATTADSATTAERAATAETATSAATATNAANATNATNATTANRAYSADGVNNNAGSGSPIIFAILSGNRLAYKVYGSGTWYYTNANGTA